jgi:hypothetical protein
VLNEAAKQRVKYLCDQIAKEQNQARFSQLIAELNEVLESAQDGRKPDARANLSSHNQTPS